MGPIVVSANSLVATFCNCGLIVVPVGKLGEVIKLSINATAFCEPVCSVCAGVIAPFCNCVSSGVATPDETQLQKGAITPAQTEQTGSQKAVALIDSLITSPSLPTGTTISPQLQNVATNELADTTIGPNSCIC